MAMTREDRAQALGMAHALPIPLRDEALEGRDRSIVIRFDAMERDGDPVVFNCVSVDDLAKLPEDTLQGLKMLTVGDDGKLKGSPDAFFMENTNGIYLYINSDNDDGMINKIMDIAMDEDLVVEMAVDDMKAFLDEDMEVVAPARAGFEENGSVHVPVRKAVDAIHARRVEINTPEDEVRNDDQDTLSPS
ncbi:MAG: hypothetical protein ABJN42_13465 [Roseibium sp.]|uniref:hypothetical protein n=1 Tax=Roseibium sp. TaxID=1936156 RepID=UPI0032978DF4